MNLTRKNRRFLLTSLLFFLTVLFLLSTLSTAADTSATAKKDLQEIYKNFKRTGDYDTMKKEHVIRFLVPYSKTFYFLDMGEQKGLTYEFIKLFEKEINEKEKSGHVRIKAIVIPTSRDRLLADLNDGIGDIAAGNLTATPERSQLVDFTNPFFENASEVLVSSKKTTVASLADLAGKEVYVRKSSSYYKSLESANAELKKQGKKPISIKEADEYLEDEDILEMINAGILPCTVVDKHKADFWAQIYPDIAVHADIVLRKQGRIGWAIRKNSPQLKKVIDDFVAKNKKGSLNFNMFAKEYLKSTSYIKNNTSEKEMAKFRNIVEIFRRYGQEYSFDWLMLAALSYQESGLDQSKKSQVGAIGIMQVMPATAKDIGIPDISTLEPNIHAGTKYLRQMTDRHFENQGIDAVNRQLFAFASYNAGPAKVDKLRTEAKESGLDPNVWFNNVELIASKRIGRETVQYVGNIYKYYIAYKLLSETGKKKQDAKKQ